MFVFLWEVCCPACIVFPISPTFPILEAAAAVATKKAGRDLGIWMVHGGWVAAIYIYVFFFPPNSWIFSGKRWVYLNIESFIFMFFFVGLKKKHLNHEKGGNSFLSTWCFGKRVYFGTAVEILSTTELPVNHQTKVSQCELYRDFLHFLVQVSNCLVEGGP